MSEEAYKTLIIRHLQGETSEAENLDLESWRKAAPENDRLFTDFEKIWLSASGSEPEHLPEMDSEWLQLAAKLHFETRHPARVVNLQERKTAPARPWAGTRYLAMAASVILVLFASFFWRELRMDHDRTAITAGIGEQETVELRDGSTVRLNSVSRLSYPTGLAGSERVVAVAGEAFFEIAKDGRPFIVETENARVRVLGTVFNVWARDRETRVIVQQGRVTLKPREADTSLELTANQMAVCSAESLSGTAIEVDARRRLGWLEGKMVFSQTPLAEVVAELQRRYDVQIGLASAHLAAETLTASFSPKPVVGILESLCLAMHLRFKQEDNRFTIYAIE